MRDGKFISFLWKPKALFSELRQYPVIISPIVIVILLLVMDAFIKFLLAPPATPSSTELGILSQEVLLNVISASVIVLFKTAYVFLLYRIIKNKQRIIDLLSIIIITR